VTAGCAQLSVHLPFTPVPVTGQTFAVLLSGAVLGCRRGFLSQLVYLAEGAAGLPVFADATGTALHLVGPSGGYLWSFPLAAALGVVGGTRCRALHLEIGGSAGRRGHAESQRWFHLVAAFVSRTLFAGVAPGLLSLRGHGCAQDRAGGIVPATRAATVQGTQERSAGSAQLQLVLCPLGWVRYGSVRSQPKYRVGRTGSGLRQAVTGPAALPGAGCGRGQNSDTSRNSSVPTCPSGKRACDARTASTPD